MHVPTVVGRASGDVSHQGNLHNRDDGSLRQLAPNRVNHDQFVNDAAIAALLQANEDQAARGNQGASMIAADARSASTGRGNYTGNGKGADPSQAQPHQAGGFSGNRTTNRSRASCAGWFVWLFIGVVFVYLEEVIYFTTGWFRGSAAQVLLTGLTISTVIAAWELLQCLCLRIKQSCRSFESRDDAEVSRRGMVCFKALLEYVAVVVCVVMISQIKACLLTPADSVVPVEWTAKDVLTMNHAEDCSFHLNWRTAQAMFANSSVDMSVVTVTVPKVKHPLAADALAMAWESNIYLFQDACEIGFSTLAHELAHVWQFQSGSIFRFRTVGETVRFPWSCRTWECIYGFGGEAGLNSTLQADSGAQITESFTIEQQAAIVESYAQFWYHDREHPAGLADWQSQRAYRDLLQHFALQILWK